MNKKQKEVQEVLLDEEKATLSELKKTYKTALDDINLNLEALLGRQDADMQHVIYQIEYQKALKTQVQGILEQLHSNEFEVISKYLTNSYTNGFVGTMYDIAGQGIPLIVPIDNNKVLDAIKHETKLNKDLYTELGFDIKKLQKTISSEISRGIATGLSYGEISRNIKNSTKVPQNRAMTIARTEAHRISCKASFDAQEVAKSKGADVLKQWDAALDGDTRPHHRQLDGQIRELDEPFEVAGKKVKYPGDFGDPAEDCNCRCAILQRARWALDEEELEVLQERAAYYGLDKTEDFKEYRKKFLKVADEESVRLDVQKTKTVNKNGEEIQFNLGEMSEESQKYIKDKTALLSNEYNTSLIEIQYDKTLRGDLGGKVEPYTGTVMQIKRADLIEHEFFHTLDSSKRLKYKESLETNENFWKESKKLFTKYKKAAINNRDVRISEYSLEKVDEFMAEAFSVAKGGAPADPFGVGLKSPYVQEAISIIDKYFKK